MMTPIVVDVGTHSTRVGWSGHDQPKFNVDRKDTNPLPDDLFDIVYSRLTRDPPSGHPVIATVPVLASKTLKKEYYETFMEQWQVPAMFLADTAVVSLFAIGKTSGQCIDMGASHVTVSQISKGETVSSHSTLPGDEMRISPMNTLLTGGASSGAEKRIKEHLNGEELFSFKAVTNRTHSGFLGASLLSSLSSFSCLFTRDVYSEKGI